MADFLRQIDDDDFGNEGFGQGGAPVVTSRGLISERRLETLSDRTQKTVHGVQEIGGGVVDTVGKLLVAMWTHARNNTSGTVIQAATDLTNVHLKRFKELASDRNSITSMVNHAEDMFKRLKADVTALADVSTKSISPDVWQKYLNQAQIIHRDLKRFHDTVVTATQDMQRAKPYLTNKLQQKFTVDDVVPVSNFCIFEQLDYEMQKQSISSDLRAMWTLFEYRFYIILLEFRAQLGRIDGSNMLVHVKPTSTLSTSTANSSPSTPVGSAPTAAVITENYSTTTQAAYDNIDKKILVNLERSIGNLLTEFYTMCNRSISALPTTSIIRKFCPPFSHSEYTIKNVYTKHLQPDFTAQIHTVIGPPRIRPGQGDYEVDEATDVQDINRSYEMPNFNLHVLKGTGEDILLERKASFIGLGGSCCGGNNPLRKIFGSRANGSVLSGGADPYVSFPEDEEDDDEYYDKDDDGDINIKISRPKKRFIKPKSQPAAKAIKTLGSSDKSSMEMRSKFVPLGAIVQLFSSISELLSQIRSTSYDEFYQNALGIVNNFELILSIETVLKRDGENQRPMAVTWQMLDETLMIYDHLIEKNDTVQPNTKTIYKETVANLKAAQHIMDKDVSDLIAAKLTAGSHYDIYLPKQFRYTKNYGIIFQYWRLNMLIQQFIRALFTSASLFNNPHTGFSLGKLNQSGQNFELDEEDRLVRFTSAGGAAPMVAELDQFKIDLKFPFFAQKVIQIDADIVQINNAVKALNDAYKAAKNAVSNAQDKDACNSFLKQIIIQKSCGLLGEIYKPQVDGQVGGYDDEEITTEWFKVIGNAASRTNLDIPKAMRKLISKLFTQNKNANYSGILCFFSKIVDLPPSSQTDPFYKECCTIALLKQGLKGISVLINATDDVEPNQKDLDRIKALRDRLNAYVTPLGNLKAESFEKKFSTSIIPVNQPIVEAFVRSGYGEFLKQRFSMALYFMGPSGSGKTFNQYGQGATLGIDARLLDLPRQQLSFRDYYGLAFYAIESFDAAVKRPTVYHYSLTSVNDQLQVAFTQDENKSKEENITISNFAGYKDAIDHVRRANQLIRATRANPDGSSRSFFITTITQDNNIKKSLIDTPGYEALTAGSAHTNPFLFIFAKVFEIGSRISLLNLTQNDYAAWASNVRAGLVSELNGPIGLTEAMLNIEPRQVPTPAKVNTSSQPILEYGLMSCTFKEFIDSCMLFVGDKFVSNQAGKDRVNTFTNKTQFRKVPINIANGYYISRYKETQYGKNPQTITDVNPGQLVGSTDCQSVVDDIGLCPVDPLLFTNNGKQNLAFDKKHATYMMYTWAIYEAMFSNSQESSTKTIMTKYLQTFVPPQYHDVALQTLEAVFINQFNFWAQIATLKKGNESLLNYLNPKTPPVISINDLYYECLVAVSDVSHDHAFTNAAYDRYRYSQNPPIPSIVITNASLSPVGIIVKYHAPNLTLSTLIDSYNNNSFLYNPYAPLGDLSAFNTYINNNGGKNLFVTILNGGKAPAYFSFMDINRAKTTPPPAPGAPTAPPAATP